MKDGGNRLQKSARYVFLVVLSDEGAACARDRRYLLLVMFLSSRVRARNQSFNACCVFHFARGTILLCSVFGTPYSYNTNLSPTFTNNSQINVAPEKALFTDRFSASSFRESESKWNKYGDVKDCTNVSKVSHDADNIIS